MKKQTIQTDVLLLSTAVIWGFAFVAQRAGMEYIGPFAFNGIRFALGSLSLVPLILLQQRGFIERRPRSVGSTSKMIFIGGSVTGMALFAGSSLQQVGLVYTTAGKAGFITGLYVVIVPILGYVIGQRASLGTWIGAVLATVGLYLLSVTESFTVSFGDLLEMIGAVFWSVHVLLVGRFSTRIEPIILAFLQFAVCALLSLAFAVCLETISLGAIADAALPILYGGLGSVGVAYTLQIVAQRNANPAHAAILLSLESVFAALGGWLILGEILSIRGITGCLLMLSAMLLSQLHLIMFKRV